MNTALPSRQNEHLILESFPVGNLGCNCSLIYSPQTGEAIIIDPGNDADYLLGILRSKNLTPKLLLHTHAHFDHIGGSSKIEREFQSPLWLHPGDEFLYRALPQQALFFGERVEAPAPLKHFIRDEQLFGFEQTTLADPKLKTFLKTLHTPGHTPGSCSFYTEYFEEPVLFSGDTLFEGSIGRTDLPGGDQDLIFKSIKSRLYHLPGETYCIPGHGAPTWIHREKKHNPFVRG